MTKSRPNKDHFGLRIMQNYNMKLEISIILAMKLPYLIKLH